MTDCKGMLQSLARLRFGCMRSWCGLQSFSLTDRPHHSQISYFLELSKLRLIELLHIAQALFPETGKGFGEGIVAASDSVMAVHGYGYGLVVVFRTWLPLQV